MVFPFHFLLAPAQNLTLNDLVLTCKMANWDEVNELLLKKNWEYYESSKGDDEHYSTITWSYDKQNYSDAARGWFYLYTYEGHPNKIRYIVFNKNAYNTIKSQLVALGMKLTASSIKDDEIEATYANASYIMNIATAKRKEEDSNSETHTAYTIDVVNKAGVYDPDNGLKKNYYSDGNVKSEYTLKNGKLTGKATSYYPSGKVEVISNFVSDLKQGPSTEYDEDGNISAKYNYYNGELDGEYRTYENGKLHLVGKYSNKKKSGPFKVYNADGSVDWEYEMKEGVADGPHASYFYNDGKLFLKIIGQNKNGKKSGRWETYYFGEKGKDLLDYKNYYDDIRSGPFRLVTSDSIIYGNYVNGELDGRYTIHSNLTAWLTGVPSADTVKSSLITRGYYSGGNQHGNWKYYSRTKQLIREGRFDGGLESGEWKYYFDDAVGSNGPLPYAGKLVLVENFSQGKKNGRSIRYYESQRRQVKCDTTSGKLNPVDTCYISYRIKELQTAYYKDDLLHGPFEYQDSTGSVILKGNFVNDEKNDEWFEAYPEEENHQRGILKGRGRYLMGNRVGEWICFYGKNEIFASFTYSNGQLHGKSVRYLQTGKPGEEHYYDNGYLKKVIAFDTTGSTVKSIYEIAVENESGLKCRRTTFEGAFRTSQDYFIKKNDSEPLRVSDFELYFMVRVTDDSANAYTDGEFKIYDNDKVYIEGALQKDVKVGKWKTYFHEAEAFSEQNFNWGIASNEKFFNVKTGALYSGRLLTYYRSKKLKSDLKISGGVKDGVSKYYHEDGGLERTEKYIKGVLQK
jgi:antitoxin component YwqK of YwqJK toxin-antitoxin module